MNESNFEKKDEQSNLEAQNNPEFSKYIEASANFIETLPSPIVLQQYESLLPNTSDRIISMIEKEQEHRQKMHEKVLDIKILKIKQERYETRLKHIFGFCLGIISITSGSIITIWKSPLAGSLNSLLGVVAVVFIFFLSRKSQQKSHFSADIKNDN